MSIIGPGNCPHRRGEAALEQETVNNVRATREQYTRTPVEGQKCEQSHIILWLSASLSTSSHSQQFHN